MLLTPSFYKKKIVRLHLNEVTDFNLALVATLCKLILPLHRLAQAYSQRNKAGYMATPVVYGWAGAVIKITWAFGQEQ